ncbi:hypothetical protein [Photobacterium sanguinicancri]|uniref:hypothetical protein n=1 Tax=Photobacterium sanguinicancri TaxID=875932 RepID=UPI000788DBD5|nr:hypothetical protein [Photobacterium sanguinicancri]KXI21744.1 hypothetical protein AS132_19080 [Photobacterium sanguinicancri]
MLDDIIKRMFRTFMPQGTEVKTPRSREQYWEDQLIERTIGFDTTDCTEFMSKLRQRAIEFGTSVDQNNTNAAVDNDTDKINQALAVLSDESVEHIPVEKDKRTIDDLIDKYLNETYKSLDSFFEPVYQAIQDECKYVVTSNDWNNSKGKKKSKGAAKSYAHYDGICVDYISCLLVLFDTTLFGSGSDGLAITSDFIAFKSLGDDKEFIYISELESVSYNRSSKELAFNNKRYNYVHTELNGPAKLVFESLQDYLNQPSLKLRKHLNS